MGNTFLQLTPIKGLTIRAQQSADAFDWRSSYKQYPDKQFNENSGDVQEAFQRFYSFTFTNTAEYKMDVKEEHHLSLLLGQESIIQKNETFNAHTIGHSDRRLMLLSASQTPAESGAHHSKANVHPIGYSRVHHTYRYKENKKDLPIWQSLLDCIYCSSKRTWFYTFHETIPNSHPLSTKKQLLNPHWNAKSYAANRNGG